MNDSIGQIIDVDADRMDVLDPEQKSDHSDLPQPLTRVGASARQGFLSIPLLLFLILIVFFVWASLFEIEELVRTQGEVVLSARTQVIQSPDRGVLGKLLVKEGDHVSAGQSVAEMETEEVIANLEDSKSKIGSLSAALARARAEAQGIELVFTEESLQYPAFVSAEFELYKQRKASVDDLVQTMELSLGIEEEVWAMNTALFETGDVSRIEVMVAQQKVGKIKGDIRAAENKYHQEAYLEVVKLEAELAIVRNKQTLNHYALGRTSLTSPVDGIIKYLDVNTIGAVLREGDELMQVTPTNSGLVLEIKINPVDITQLSLGMPVIIKIDAFDFSIYGSLAGELAYISPDTLTEQDADGRTMTYFKATVNVDVEEGSHNAKLSGDMLKAGLTASVDIKTGNRTILHYLAKPLIKTFGGALSER